MSQLVGPSSKRKRPGTGGHTRGGAPPLSNDEQSILDLILSRGTEGILLRGIKFEMSNLDVTAVNKALKSLEGKGLIKQVKSIKYTGRKVYMGIDCTPSKEVSGGIWYVDGKLDRELIMVLRRFLLIHINRHKVATLEEIHKVVEEHDGITIDVPIPQVAELLTAMVLDGEIIEVKSTGLGDYYGRPVGKICYRVASSEAGAGKSLIAGAFASIPCGMCPKIAMCRPDGVISPSTCVYYNKWLDIQIKSNR